MMELGKRNVFTLLHLAFGFLHKRGFRGRKHVVGINDLPRHAFSLSDCEKLMVGWLEKLASRRKADPLAALGMTCVWE
jgi:hypothetical protein